MPDVLPVPDEVAALRAASMRLRQVAGAKDAEVVVLRAQLEAYQAQLEELQAEMETLRAPSVTARPGLLPSTGPAQSA